MTPQEQWAENFKKAQDEFDKGNEAEAEKLLALCCQQSPEMWVGLGVESMEGGDSAGALKRFKEALAFSKRPPTRAACLNNIGSILANGGHRTEAAGYFLEAMQVFPGYPDSYANLALIRKWNGQLDEALALCNKALSMNPHHQHAAFTKSLVLLLMGDYERGLPAYESRWRNKGTGIRKLEFPRPEWNGSNAKTVFVYAEQGSGDVIMMLRYVRKMVESGLTVYGGAPTWLKSLMLHAGCARVYLPGEVMQPFDAHISAMSLPRVFGTRLDSIPYPDGYIQRPEPSPTIQRGPGLNVGMCWRGSTVFRQDLWRSTHLDLWRELLETDGVTWHNLHVGEGDEEVLLYPQIRDYEKPADFMETARRMMALDLVISTDTSVVHLAGALGVPCWVAMMYAPDWRWMLGREDTPWYSSLRLFRQPAEFAWKPVFQRLKTELVKRINDPHPGNPNL